MIRMKSYLLCAFVIALHAVTPSRATTNSDQSGDAIVGTHWVKFQPTSIEGKLSGCSLTYLAVQNDYVYRRGEPVIVNGSIGLARTQRSVGLMLKVGLKDVGKQDAKFEAPHFAFLQGGKSNTARATGSVSPGENGYKLFVYSISSPEAMDVLSDLMSGGKISIQFNRQKGGMDVPVPIDIFVVDSTYEPDYRVKRKYSNQTAESFGACTVQLLDELKTDISK